MQVVAGDGFSGWQALNDTVMGGRSSGSCTVSSRGLRLEAEVVEQGGGFVSCRSPLFSPPLDLSEQAAFELELQGDGRHYKLAVACADGVAGLTEMIPGGVRWVANFATAAEGPCRLRIPFDQLRPSIRARPIEALPPGPAAAVRRRSHHPTADPALEVRRRWQCQSRVPGRASHPGADGDPCRRLKPR